jgi:hypothetical protein
MFGDRGNREQIRAWPIEDHGQGAQIVNIATYIGIKVYLGHYNLSRLGAESERRRCGLGAARKCQATRIG